MTTDAQWQAWLAREAEAVEAAAAAVEAVSTMAALNERVAVALVLCESEP